MPSLCKHDGCTTGATFNVLGETKGRFCGQHKEIGMVDVRNKRCEQDGCTSLSPLFNFPGETKGLFCGQHKEVGMVDVRNKRCEQDGCTSLNPLFNFPGETKGRFCGQHKESGMVDVRHKRCEQDGCTSQPVFNFPGETKGRFCGQHKEIGMVDVKTKRCEQDGCTSQPVFNFPGETKGRFCGQHKESGMVDVKTKRCEQDGCTSLSPLFNFPGETKGRFCGQHKEVGMVDVRNKRCEQDGCTSQPSYGYPGQSSSFCATHKVGGTMLDSKKRCTVQDCKNWSTHGLVKPQRCETHAMSTDTNLVQRACQNCNFVDIVNRDGLCGSCDHWFCKRPRLAKQNEVFQFLVLQMPDNPCTSIDKIPIGLKDCGDKERPDGLWELADRNVILEVDEDQHDTRPCHCEQTRMMNISQALGCERTIWIRYNPDSFKSSESRKWSSAHKRLHLLKKYLEWAFKVDLTTLSTISVVYLFFDDFEEGKVKVETLL